jgi:hypothetical protein
MACLSFLVLLSKTMKSPSQLASCPSSEPTKAKRECYLSICLHRGINKNSKIYTYVVTNKCRHKINFIIYTDIPLTCGTHLYSSNQVYIKWM